MNARVYQAFVDELEKTALLERLVRLGATDIPKTPRLLMRQRGPAELKALQDSVSAAGQKHIEKPLMGFFEKGLQKLPAGKVQNVARAGANMIAKDPIGGTLSSAVPVPGATVAYFGGKKLLEKSIDRAFPL